MMDSPRQQLIAYRVAEAAAMPLTPAPRTRDWIEATTERFARRCLPLLVANEAGWFIRNAQTIQVTWTGEDAPSSLRIEYETDAGPYAVTSHFGHGILTWSLPYLFRTPADINLLVRGPSNWPKDGVAPLEGVVETDWAVGTFTMNWKITRPHHCVTFEAGEPICMLVPYRRRDLEDIEPVVQDIDSEPELAVEYGSWQQSRARFLAQLAVPGSAAAQAGWQRDYFRGQSPTGARARHHQLRLRLQAFGEESSRRESGSNGTARAKP